MNRYRLTSSVRALTTSSFNRLIIGIRVLTDISFFRQPDPEDVKALREAAATDAEREMPLDELARTVIERERKRTDPVQAARC